MEDTTLLFIDQLWRKLIEVVLRIHSNVLQMIQTTCMGDLKILHKLYG